jgi:putative ABC transport system substrate-binding protein
LLTPYAPETEVRWHKAFEQALNERGYVQGRNVAILYRFAQGRDKLLPDLAAELVRLKVDVLLTVGTPATRAAQRATSTVPIVMVTVLDPVHAGFVANLARPGGNITGSSELSEELVPKRLELLKEAIPRAALIAVLWDPTHPTNALDLKRTEDAARTLGLKVRGAAAHGRGEVDKAFMEMNRWHADALIVLTSYSAFVQLPRIVELANRYKLPTMYGTREGVEAGALMSYGPNVADQYRHAAAFVDKILKGADPANLPVEQPTRFELVVNMVTAKMLGITFPPSILVRAEEVIK